MINTEQFMGYDKDCPHCGKTLRRRIGYKKKVERLCSTYIEEGMQAYPGVRIPDESAARQDIREPTVAEEVYSNGKKLSAMPVLIFSGSNFLNGG